MYTRIFKLILILSLLLPCSAFGASRLYYHNFDDGLWGDVEHDATGGDSEVMGITTDQANSGSYSAYVDFTPPNNLQHIHYDDWQSDYDDELFIRFYFYHHANYKHAYNTKIMRMEPSFQGATAANYEWRQGGNGSDPEYFWDTDTQYWNNSGNLSSPTTCTSTSQNISNATLVEFIAPGEWVKFECYIKLNTQGNADGVHRMWLNDVLVKSSDAVYWICDDADPQSSTYKYGCVNFPSNYADTSPSGTPIMYIDDFEIYTDQNGGTVVTGTMLAGDITVASGDTTAPELSTAPTTASGEEIIYTFNEAVTFGAGGTGTPTITSDGGAVTLTYVDQPTTSTIRYSFSRRILGSETLTTDYTQGGNEIEDLAGNDLASFADVSVTNNAGTAVNILTHTVVNPLYEPADSTILKDADIGVNVQGYSANADTDRTDDVETSGDQTISGIKTFSSSPIVPTPTTDYQACTKAYADSISGGTTDPNAIHDNTASEISAVMEKVSPVSADMLIIEDSEDSNNKKMVQVGNLPGDGTGTDDQNATEVPYSNTTSGLTATDAQAAIDEIEARTDTNDAKVSDQTVSNTGDSNIQITGTYPNFTFSFINGSGFLTAESDPTVDSSAEIQAIIGASIYQPYDADLTTYAGITPAVNVQSLLGAADYAAFKTLLSLNNVPNSDHSTQNYFDTDIHTLDNIPDGTTYKLLTAAQQGNIHASGSDAETAASIEDIISGATEDTSPQGAWVFPTVVSGELGWLSFTNLQTWIETFTSNFNGAYSSLTGIPKTATLILVGGTTDVAVADKQGDITLRIPAEMTGTWNLTLVIIDVETAGTTGVSTFQVRNVTDAQDMLSTLATIDSGETSTATAATPLVINTSFDDVTAGDLIAIDCDGVSTTAPKGLKPELQFTKQ